MEGHDELSGGAIPDDAADAYTDGTYTFHHDWTGTIPLHYSVVSGVGAVTNTEPHALPALYDVIDPDCLDQLFLSATEAQRSDLAISFRFADCAVRVDGTGEVTIRPADRARYA